MRIRGGNSKVGGDVDDDDDDDDGSSGTGGGGDDGGRGKRKSCSNYATQEQGGLSETTPGIRLIQTIWRFTGYIPLIAARSTSPGLSRASSKFLFITDLISKAG